MVKTDLLSYKFEYMKGDLPITPRYFSSGEREIFDFLAGVISTNVMHGIVVIDEPELHLHPRWQTIYLDLFEKLGVERNLQFILATHSPVFVTHETISAVTRIYRRDGASRHIAIASDALPQQTHLIRIVHSHNNERIFFADRVALVEGITDRLMFESLVQKYARLAGKIEICEVVEVHGKANFGAYAKLLRAIDMPYCIIADLDYCLDVGGRQIKTLFETDFTAIDRKVVADKKSRNRVSIAAAIERALVKRDFSELEALWNFVKGRYPKLREDLDASERFTLDSFLLDRRKEGIYILRAGELEDYLPAYGGGLVHRRIQRIQVQRICSAVWVQVKGLGSALCSAM